MFLYNRDRKTQLHILDIFSKGGGKRIQIFKSFFEVVTEFTFTFFHKENQNFLNYVIEPICKKKLNLV